MGSVFVFALAFAAAGALAAPGLPEPPTAADRTPPPPAELTTAPRQTTPADDITRSLGTRSDLLTLVASEVSRGEAAALNLSEPGRHQEETEDIVTSSAIESPGSIASSWSMPPLPADGSWATSGTSQSPVTKSSSSVMAVVGR
jgi:hypothetical protein